MGNCSPKPKSRSKTPKSPPPPVRIYGSESCPITYRIRIALLYKSVPFVFVPVAAGVSPHLRVGSDNVPGPNAESILRYLDSRFGGAAAIANEDVLPARRTVELQHRSMKRHVAGMEVWAREEVVGSTSREGRRLGEWYGKWAELMMEHAQMEERLLFPAFARATNRGVCRKATEEHGRDLPLINGIKEDIKSLLVIESGTPLYQEALINLSLRFKTLQEHCKEHFAEEEKELLPLLELAEGTRREEGEEPWSPQRWGEQVMSLMKATHSNLFPFFMAGLLPEEAMQYVDLVCRCVPPKDSQQVVVVEMLRSLTCLIEGTLPLSWIRTTPLLKSTTP